MSTPPPTARPPTADDLREVAEAFSMDLDEEALADYVALAERAMGAHERLDELEPPAPPRAEATREAGGRPAREEDPHNAFVTRCSVRGPGGGPLDGWRVAVKDNVAVADVGLTCGSSVLDGYVPDVDATVVRRVLAAGASVVGKTNMDELAVSGSGGVSAFGPVRNPRDPAYLAGGSSGGSAVAVVTGEADAALGTDQAGSVRIPSAWSGCVGLKPTYGLVPYTGIAGLGHTFDHAGPMAPSVRACARLLDAVAGPDPLDPRQRLAGGAVAGEPPGFAAALDPAPEGVRVGLLAEGFDREEGDPAVDGTVRGAVQAMVETGWSAEDVSVPIHADGPAIWVGVATEENTALVRAEGLGHFVDGFYDEAFAEAFGRARRAAADDIPPTLAVRLLLGGYLAERYRGRYHARAQNLRRSLGAAYDEALEGVDVLAMPATPMTAHAVDEDASKREVVRRARDMGGNTSPFNLTGHPAVTVPCGTVDGLPVGLMLVGRRGGDAALLAAAAAAERRVSPYR